MFIKLEELEQLAWVNYLDNRSNKISSPRLFEYWKDLWIKLNRPIPEGAWM